METKGKRLEISIKGDVQGVSFRYYARDIAKKLGITGWIRNEADGSISLTVECKEENLQNFLNWCRQGSPMATIEKVESREGKYTGEFKDFEVR